MSPLRLVPLLCCFLVPLQALAQAQPSGEGPTAPASPPPLIPAPEATRQDAPTQPPRGEIIPPAAEATRGSAPDQRSIRIPAGILLGTLGGAVGATPGVLLFYTSDCFDGGCSGDQVTGVYFIAVVALVGAVGGTAWAIDKVGASLDGLGRFWPTVGGVVLGALGGALLGARVSSYSGAAGAAIAVLGPAVGGVIAYEVTHSNAVSAAAARSASRPGVVPLVSMTPRGGFIGGLAGSF